MGRRRLRFHDWGVWPARAALWGVWMLGYRLLVGPPAPVGDRCVMGSVVHPWAWCPRAAVPGSLWCVRHHPEDWLRIVYEHSDAQLST